MLITLRCPECRKETVFNGSGRCGCGVYLIGPRWPKGQRRWLPQGQVYLQNRDGGWVSRYDLDTVIDTRG